MKTHDVIIPRLTPEYIAELESESPGIKKFYSIEPILTVEQAINQAHTIISRSLAADEHITLAFPHEETENGGWIIRVTVKSKN